MKKWIIALAFLVSMQAEAQIINVELQASGLTCSMCSNAIYKSLRALEFVDSIVTDLKRYVFTVFFKSGQAIDFDRMRRSVEKAGFSVSGFVVSVRFRNTLLKKEEPVVIENQKLLFAEPGSQLVDGIRQIRILDKGFVSPGAVKNKPPAASSTAAGIYHAALAN